MSSVVYEIRGLHKNDAVLGISDEARGPFLAQHSYHWVSTSETVSSRASLIRLPGRFRVNPVLGLGYEYGASASAGYASSYEAVPRTTLGL
jgi:hypothetical protein